MLTTASVWATKRANFVMGASIATLGAMATPTVREKVHEVLHIEEENQATFDVIVVSAATILGLYGLYQRGRGDAAAFILNPPDGKSQTWFITNGKRKSTRAWKIMGVDPSKVVVERV